ncbi:MAG TPA: hypothetical protein VGH50_18050 [Candidatus Binatia bacterium]
MKSRRLIVVGTLASNPYAGMAWMHMQIAAGLRRLGHDVYYFETTSAWPYDPERAAAVDDSRYALPYLERVAAAFGLGDRWAYRRSYSDKRWLGVEASKAEDLLAQADAVLNITGATRFAEEGLRVGRLVYVGTDPGVHEIGFAEGDPDARAIVEEHDDCVTYGENIGKPGCAIPPLPRLRAATRQPVLLDCWHGPPPSNPAFTTVGNWRQAGRDLSFRGETYFWSKHREFVKFIDVPKRAAQPVELATGLDNLGDDDAELLRSNGWRLVDAHPLTLSPQPYRDYICASRGELTAAKDLNVRLKSGWFSERSACYLAAGRPVITQDTGFDSVLPTGRGLFAFNTAEDIVAALDAINSDYERESRAARAIAEEYFKAETVLARLLSDLGL